MSLDAGRDASYLPWKGIRCGGSEGTTSTTASLDGENLGSHGQLGFAKQFVPAALCEVALFPAKVHPDSWFGFRLI